MVELTERTMGFAERASNLQGDRKAAIDAFLAVGMPTHRDEEFKYLPLRDLTASVLITAPVADLTPDEFDALPISQVDGPRLVFVNGAMSRTLSYTGKVPGLTFESSENAKGVGSVATFEGKLGSTNDPRFVHLNDALWTSVARIDVAAGAVIEEAIQVIYVSTTAGAAFDTHPRTLVTIGRNAQANLVETYVGTGGVSFTNAVTEVSVAQDAILEHTRIQHESREAFHIGHLWVHQESSSTYTSTSVQFGAKVGRCDINVCVDGEHTETWLNGAYVGKGEQTLDNHTRIDHAKPNCHSFEVYKGILDDQSTGVFNGKIFVYEDAQKTDAKQTNQALLLSPRATINTKPQLEIFADDVKCTHGATVGQLREDAMFYLRSRGIDQVQARNLLVYAFVAEVLEKITVDDVREYLERELTETLG